MARQINPNIDLIKALMPPSGVAPPQDMATMAIPQQNAPVPSMQNMPKTQPQPQPQGGGGLSGFLGNLSDTPAKRAALMKFATDILQPVDPRTQTVAGRFGQALGTSMDYLDQLREQERQARQQAEQLQYEREQAEQKMALEERRVQAAERTAATGERRAATEEMRGEAAAERDTAYAWYLRNKKDKDGAGKKGQQQTYAESFAEALYKADQKKPIDQRKYTAQNEAYIDAVQHLEASGKKTGAAATADFLSRVAPELPYMKKEERAMIRDIEDQIKAETEAALPYQFEKPGVPAPQAHRMVTVPGVGLVPDLTGDQQAYDDLEPGSVFVWGGQPYRKE